MNREDLVACSLEPNVAAFLRVIRACEGTAGERGYQTIYGYRYFESFAAHPNQSVTANGYTSTAAGAYQFLKSTWDEVAAKHGITDFTPSSQDAGAVARLIYRGALDDVRAGRLDAAVEKCNKEWASLPGSPYGQPRRTMAFVTETFEQWRGAAAARKENNVSPFIIPALEALVGLVPTIGQLFKGESPSRVAERNSAAFQAIVDKLVPIVVQASGQPNLQGAAEAAQRAPDVAAAIDEGVRENFAELHAMSEKSIAAARDFNVAVVKAGIKPWEMGALWISAALLLPLYYVIYRVMNFDLLAAKDLITQVVSSVLTIIGLVGMFWLGTSIGSQRKTGILAKEREQ